jgi:AraC-like DNA-binding protein
VIRRRVEYEDHDAPMSRVEVPTLGVALILSFGPTMRVEGQTVSSFLVGMWDKPALTEHDGHAHGIQIDLAPAVAYALVGGRMDELTNRVIDVGELDVLNVDRLLETGGAAAADELAGAVQRGPSVSREVSWVYAQLQRRPSTRIASLADEIGWSRSHLVDRFRREVGLTPKRFARVVRFRSAFDRLGQAPLATVAAECGYADQSHLTHEFREMAGAPPTAYQATFVQDGV